MTLPSGRNAGLRAASASADVSRRGVSSTANSVPDVRVLHLDRDDLVLEAALVDRRDRAPVRLERERVELLAREAPLLGDHLGRDPLRDDLPALEQLVREVAAVRPHRHARHHLDAGRDDEVELARPDRGRRVEVRLHRRAALAVDGRPGHRLRPAGDHRHHPADVPALLADLRHAADLDVLDLARIDVVPREEPVQDLSRELVAANRGQRAVPLADRRANGVEISASDSQLGIDYRVEAPGSHALELVLAAILERDPGAGDEVLDGAGDEHLAGRRLRRDARARPAPRSRSASLRAARTRPCGRRRGSRARARATSSDDRARTVDRPRRPVEGGEEAVAGGVQLLAPEPRELAAHSRVVALEQLAPGLVAELAPRARSSRRCR